LDGVYAPDSGAAKSLDFLERKDVREQPIDTQNHAVEIVGSLAMGNPFDPNPGVFRGYGTKITR
jgi:hypothetical protein